MKSLKDVTVSELYKIVENAEYNVSPKPQEVIVVMVTVANPDFATNKDEETIEAVLLVDDEQLTRNYVWDKEEETVTCMMKVAD